MKASEVIKQYNEGRRDFRGENLRGQSFKKANLSGAGFNECDIRGTNFKEITLIGTKFTNAKARLQKQWIVISLMGLYLLAAVSGIFSIWQVLLQALLRERGAIIKLLAGVNLCKQFF
jgi:uncharacterized protein YjbI with pentapeptide repeats